MQAEATRPVRYPAAFREGDGPIGAGVVVIEGNRLLLEGRRDADRVELAILYEELTQVRLGHRIQERLHGYVTVVLMRLARPPLLIAPLGFGLRAELADTLATLAGKPAGAAERIAIVVPLRSGRHEQVRALVAQGPPFDAAALGLVRHDVVLTPDEATFVLEGPDVHEVLRRALEEPGFWRVGLSWRENAAGPPRLAGAPIDLTGAGELVYSWVANEM